MSAQDPRVVYTGSWKQAGLVTRSPVGRGSAKLVFTGTNIAWIAQRDSASGVGAMSLDGAAFQTRNLSSTTAEPDQIISKHGFDGSGSHTVVISPAGARPINLEAFLILTQPTKTSTSATEPTPTPPAPPAIRMTASNASFYPLESDGYRDTVTISFTTQRPGNDRSSCSPPADDCCGSATSGPSTPTIRTPGRGTARPPAALRSAQAPTRSASFPTESTAPTPPKR